MSFFPPLACIFGRHDPLRRYVKHDGRKYVGKCRHCGTAIERIAPRQWRSRTDRPSEAR